MKLSISNIAWSSEQDIEMFDFLQRYRFTGLEIAPTRIFTESPYNHIDEAKFFADMLKSEYGLVVSSMQSIWYGKNEKIFGSEDERRELVEYTKDAVDFAVTLGCGNIVFGCPKNRRMIEGADMQIAYDFFSEIASYAWTHGTVIAIEANPPIYGTNFINRTEEAFEFAKNIKNLAVNVDVGTIIENSESLQMIAGNLELVNHVHISEPNLEKIKKRNVHKELIGILKRGSYNGYVSIEMKNLGNIEVVKDTIKYLRALAE